MFLFANRLVISFYFIHCLPIQRPLTLTPTARSGCGLYSLVAHVFDDSVIARFEAEKSGAFCSHISCHLGTSNQHQYGGSKPTSQLAFTGGFFLGDRHSLKHWYNLCCDTLRLFLAQTNILCVGLSQKFAGTVLVFLILFE